MIVIGVDPGTVRTGYGLIEVAGSRLRHIDNGIIAPNRSWTLSEKVLHIHENLLSILDEFKPVEMSLEDIFIAKNARSALVLGHARGVTLLAAASRGIRVFGYAPAVLKKAVTGNGQASKPQVQEMVKVLLGLPEVSQEDASDALALAICHSFGGGGTPS